MDCISDEAQTKKMLESLADPTDPDRIQYHRDQQALLAPSVRQYAALTGSVTMMDVLDLLALVMDELPGVKGWTKKARKVSFNDALVRAYKRWMAGERM